MVDSYIEKTIHFNLVCINVFKIQKICLFKIKILMRECNILRNVIDYFFGYLMNPKNEAVT